MLRLCLVGNPNCGKSTVFNLLTGTRANTGNWPGVTVENTIGIVDGAASCHLIDLPGIYALRKNTRAEERITCDFLNRGDFDVIVNIIDVAALERSVYLTVQLLELGFPMIIVLNKSDLFEKGQADQLAAQLKKNVHCNVLEVSAKHSDSLPALRNLIVAVKKKLPNTVDLLPLYPAELREEVRSLQSLLCGSKRSVSTYEMLECLMMENNTFPEIKSELETIRERMRATYGDDTSIALTDIRYTVAKKILNAIDLNHIKSKAEIREDMLDKLFLGRMGMPIFLFIIYCMFSFSIAVGVLFKDFFAKIAKAFFILLPQSVLADLGYDNAITDSLVTGIGSGFVTIAEFIPVIWALYLFLSCIEESGYLARSAFVINKMFAQIGLRGQVLIPLIIGFGCNVPAIMSARIIDDMRSKAAVIMAIPFMSCSARLSVFSILGATFFTNDHQNIIFALYVLGVCFGVGTLAMLSKLMPTDAISSIPFIIELPRYQLPKIRTILDKSLHKLKEFAFGAGKLIIVVCFILHIMSTFSINGALLTSDKENSILVHIGKAITPVFKPIGLAEENWPASVSLVAGIMAKEVVIGTMSYLYSDEVTEKEDKSSFQMAILDAFYGVCDTLKIYSVEPEDKNKKIADSMHNVFGFGAKLTVLSYMIFVLLYFPCVSVFAVISRELGVKWAIASGIWSTFSAYVVSSCFYQLGLYFADTDALVYYFFFVAASVCATISYCFFMKKSLH